MTPVWAGPAGPVAVETTSSNADWEILDALAEDDADEAAAEEDEEEGAAEDEDEGGGE